MTPAGRSQLGSDDWRVGLRFLAALPRCLRTPLSPEAMRAIVRGRFARRGARFLATVDRGLRLPGSPYARLFAHAGCSAADVAAAVRRDGIEGALATLYRAGVYLACDEFKGRTRVGRGSLAFGVDPATLVSPGAVVHGLAESSGSRGARTPVPIDLAFVRDHGQNAPRARGRRRSRLDARASRCAGRNVGHQPAGVREGRASAGALVHAGRSRCAGSCAALSLGGEGAAARQPRRGRVVARADARTLR